MLHKDVGLGDNHRIQNWEVADGAALLALSVVTADEGKFARRLDNNEFYFLANASGPVWTLAIGGQVPSGGSAGQVLTKIDGTAFNADWQTPSGGGGGSSYTKLTANRTYYVRTDGSNSNDGLTNASGGAFLTIQHAVDIVSETIDNDGFIVTIQVIAGTYNERVNLKPFRGHGINYLQGDVALPVSVIVNAPSNLSCFQMRQAAGNIWYLRYMKLQANTGSFGYGIINNGGDIGLTGITFGAALTAHMLISDKGFIQIITNYTIDGDAPTHLQLNRNGVFQSISTTLTLSGTRAFSAQFLLAEYGGLAMMPTMTFTGTATGKRYTVKNRATCIASASTTYFPGSVAGTTATESFYGAPT